jgi:hypothetical protein
MACRTARRGRTFDGSWVRVRGGGRRGLCSEGVDLLKLKRRFSWRQKCLRASWSNSFNRSNESVAAAWQGLDESWLLGGIAERLAQAVYGGIQAMLKIAEGIAWPELLLQLFAGDQFSRPTEQRRQNVKRLSAQAYPDASPSQFLTSQVHLEGAEAKDFHGLSQITHGDPPLFPHEFTPERSGDIPTLERNGDASTAT